MIKLGECVIICPKKYLPHPPLNLLPLHKKAKPTSQPILQPLIDKARAEVAARQPAAAAAKAAPKAAAAAAPKKAPPKTIYDDSPDESGEPEAVKKAAAAPAPAAKKPGGGCGRRQEEGRRGRGPRADHAGVGQAEAGE